jgi:hypothetical protein
VNVVVKAMTQLSNQHLEMDLFAQCPTPSSIHPQLPLMSKPIILQCFTKLFSHNTKSLDGYNLFEVELDHDLSYSKITQCQGNIWEIDAMEAQHHPKGM